MVLDYNDGSSAAARASRKEEQKFKRECNKNLGLCEKTKTEKGWLAPCNFKCGIILVGMIVLLLVLAGTTAHSTTPPTGNASFLKEDCIKCAWSKDEKEFGCVKTDEQQTKYCGTGKKYEETCCSDSPCCNQITTASALKECKDPVVKRWHGKFSNNNPDTLKLETNCSACAVGIHDPSIYKCLSSTESKWKCTAENSEIKCCSNDHCCGQLNQLGLGECEHEELTRISSPKSKPSSSKDEPSSPKDKPSSPTLISCFDGDAVKDKLDKLSFKTDCLFGNATFLTLEVDCIKCAWSKDEKEFGCVKTDEQQTKYCGTGKTFEETCCNDSPCCNQITAASALKECKDPVVKRWHGKFSNNNPDTLKLETNCSACAVGIHDPSIYKCLSSTESKWKCTAENSELKCCSNAHCCGQLNRVNLTVCEKDPLAKINCLIGNPTFYTIKNDCIMCAWSKDEKEFGCVMTYKDQPKYCGFQKKYKETCCRDSPCCNQITSASAVKECKNPVLKCFDDEKLTNKNPYTLKLEENCNACAVGIHDWYTYKCISSTDIKSKCRAENSDLECCSNANCCGQLDRLDLSECELSAPTLISCFDGDDGSMNMADGSTTVRFKLRLKTDCIACGVKRSFSSYQAAKLVYKCFTQDTPCDEGNYDCCWDRSCCFLPSGIEKCEPIPKPSTTTEPTNSGNSLKSQTPFLLTIITTFTINLITTVIAFFLTIITTAITITLIS